MVSGIVHYDHTFHSGATGVAAGTDMDVDGIPVLGVQVEGITNATVTFYGTIDASTWYPLQGMNVQTGAVASAVTADSLFILPCAGLSQVRCAVTAHVAGTIVVVGKGVMAASGLSLADIDIAGQEDINVAQLGGVAPQLDDTDKFAVSVYGKGAAAGDTAMDVDGDGHVQVDVLSISAGANNIGDVDVLTVPGALQGPGNPTLTSYTTAAVSLLASTANQTLVAAQGANTQIWVYSLIMLADTAAGTVALQDEDDTPLSGAMAVSDEGGFVMSPSGNFAMPWIKVPTNKALEADTGACTVGGTICYGVVSV